MLWLKIILWVLPKILELIEWLNGNDPTYTETERVMDAQELGASLVELRTKKDAKRFDRFHERMRARKSRRLLAMSQSTDTVA